VEYRTACQRRLDARLKVIEDAGFMTPTMAEYLRVPTYERVRYILRLTCRRYRSKPEEILGPTRGTRLQVACRHEAMYLASMLTQHRVGDLGPMFKRDYSTLSSNVFAFARRWGLAFNKLDPEEGITAALILTHGIREAIRMHPYIRRSHVEHPFGARQGPGRYPLPEARGRVLEFRRSLPGERPGRDAPLAARAEG
jgi:Bacterial dnaA protein helix-turn-helix